MPQEFAQPRRTREEQVSEELPQARAQAEALDIDVLLDDIDSVLESNATGFVRGFVQKGGQ